MWTLSLTTYQHLLKSRGPNSLDGLSDFRFETIPDSLPPSLLNVSQDLISLCVSISKNFLAPFSDLLLKLNSSATSNIPPVSCIISDGFTVGQVCCSDRCSRTQNSNCNVLHYLCPWLNGHYAVSNSQGQRHHAT